MRFLTISTLIIFLMGASLFSLQTILTSKAYSDDRTAQLTIIEDQRQWMVRRMCMAKWPERGRLYDDCLKQT